MKIMKALLAVSVALGCVPSLQAAPATQTRAGDGAVARKSATLKQPRSEQAVDALWAEIYTRPERLAALDKPVVCLLDIQHPEKIRPQLQTLARPLDDARPRKLKSRLAELSGLECLVVHQSEVTGKDLDRPQIKAIMIGGRSKNLGRKFDEQFFTLIRTTKIPMIGFCGGCQLIGSAFGVKTKIMRMVRPGETDPNPQYQPGKFKEWGFLPVQVVKPDPLFAGLPQEIVVREAHAGQVSELPPGFDLLASTAECRVQAMKHRERILYGTQFHPESYDDAHLHGQTILKNFFRTALHGQ